VQVALPPKPIDVPSVLGMAQNAAKQKLESLGLKAGTVSWVQHPDRQAFIVMSQDPPAGTKLKPGEAVNLFVNQ
jgi:beta-lactam-binding protein with PASTA domain